MHFVSLPIEILRTRPVLTFWLAALAQTLLWVAVPTLFYAAPPGGLTDFMAVARHAGQIAHHAPPLAYWLAEAAFRLAGLFGVYLLAQSCVLVTLWAVFTLGRATLGDRHAVLATLLMAGIYFLTVPTPDFSPSSLAMPLWALALLHFWRACAEERELYWFALAADLGLLLLTTALATFLILLLVLFALLHPQCRAKLTQTGAIAAGLFVLMLLIPHAIWLKASGSIVLPAMPNLRSAELIERNVYALARLMALLLLGHAGLLVMLAVGGSALRRPRAEAAVIDRAPAAALASSFIAYFALIPPLLLVIAAVIIGYPARLNFGPVVVMSGLAAVLAAGDSIAIYRQRTTVFTWFAFLLVPPALTVLATLLLPWSAAADLRISLPANDMARFFTENFERRTGQRLQYVAGDPALTGLIAIGSASRPYIFTPGNPHGPQPTLGDIVEKGAIVVWRATDSAGTPPTDLRALFPDLVPEVPRVFERRVEGRLPQLRLGWAMIRPKTQAGAPPPQ
jgi:4-amino-4-deoxy-L-arabinose transferase-like glycosyltransferase